jgi:hypothetical protein
MPLLLVTKLILKNSKSSQKSHRRSKNSDPCNPNFFHDKSELEVVGFLNHNNYTVSGSDGG